MICGNQQDKLLINASKKSWKKCDLKERKSSFLFSFFYHFYFPFSNSISISSNQYLIFNVNSIKHTENNCFNSKFFLFFFVFVSWILIYWFVHNFTRLLYIFSRFFYFLFNDFFFFISIHNNKYTR